MPMGATRTAAPHPSPSEQMKSGVTSLLESPERHARMVRFATRHQCAADAGVRNASLRDQRVSNRNGLFGVIRGLANEPFITSRNVSGVHSAQFPMKPGDAAGIPLFDVVLFQSLSLFPDGITSRQSL